MAMTPIAPGESSRRRAHRLFWAATSLLLAGCGTSTAPDQNPNNSGPAAPSEEAPAEEGRTSDTPISDLIAATPGLNGGLPRFPSAQAPQLPLNSLEALLSLTASQLSEMKEPVTIPGPELAPVPRAECDENSRPLEGIQGRVSVEAVNSPEAAEGWTCNLEKIAHYATPGGWRVWRYTDKQGRSCAYYDTSFTAPANIVSVAGGPSLGVVVLDMSDPADPLHTTTLTTLAMLAPHESLNLNHKRGLLAATTGSALTLPGSLSVYDVSEDCRYPVLKAQRPIAFGHESGFSPDGNTFWVAGGAGYILAVDVSDPTQPNVIWRGAYYSHGLSLSNDGNTLYQTDPINANVGIMDVSAIQAREPEPKVSDINRITWDIASIPQNTKPFTRDGRQYLLEFDEFAFRFNPPTIDSKVGAARIIDVTDPTDARIVSNLRLEVNMQDTHRELAMDPSALPPTQVFGYSFHYCGIPTRDNPKIVACSTMNSGLRVFDISDLENPREVAYYIAPPKAGRLLGLLPGDLATSQPEFVPERREIWYTDATSGFYVLRLSESAWPQ